MAGPAVVAPTALRTHGSMRRKALVDWHVALAFSLHVITAAALGLVEQGLTRAKIKLSSAVSAMGAIPGDPNYVCNENKFAINFAWSTSDASMLACS